MMADFVRSATPPTPSPRVGEGWGEGAVEWTAKKVLRPTVTLSLTLSAQGRGDKADANER